MLKRWFEVSEQRADDHDYIALGLYCLIDRRCEREVAESAEEVLLAGCKPRWPQAQMKSGGYGETSSPVMGSDELHDERLTLASRGVGHAVRVT